MKMFWIWPVGQVMHDWTFQIAFTSLRASYLARIEHCRGLKITTRDSQVALHGAKICRIGGGS